MKILERLTTLLSSLLLRPDKNKAEYINNVVVSTEQLVRGQWSHIACVYDGTKRAMAIYINGSASGQRKTQGCSPQSWSKPLHIGAPQPGMYGDTRAALIAVDGSHVLIGWVSSLWWFDSDLGHADVKLCRSMLRQTLRV